MILCERFVRYSHRLGTNIEKHNKILKQSDVRLKLIQKHSKSCNNKRLRKQKKQLQRQRRMRELQKNLNRELRINLNQELRTKNLRKENQRQARLRRRVNKSKRLSHQYNRSVLLSINSKPSLNSKRAHRV